MELVAKYLCTTLVLVAAFSSALAQDGEKVRRTEQDTYTSKNQTPDARAEKNEPTAVVTVQDGPQTWICLVGGRRMQVDDVTESADGFWYKQGNVSTFVDRARVEKIERSSDTKTPSLSETFKGSGKWNISDSAKVESFFMSRFNRTLPLTAFGQSDLHTRWGLDHSHGIDVGLHPDSREGKALIDFLRGEEIPFLAFRGSVPGVATGPHIHIGNGSPRLGARR